jgi:hypothetical protein
MAAGEDEGDERYTLPRRRRYRDDRDDDKADVPEPRRRPDRGTGDRAESRTDLPLVMTSYIARHLMPGEELVAVTRIHPLVMAAPGAAAALGLLLTLAGILGGGNRLALAVVGIPMAVIAGLMVLALLVERLTTEFSCTDRRVLIKTGLLTTRLREMPLAKVEALVMKQGLFGKLFGYGTVVLKGSGGTRRECGSIEAPFAFYRRVQEQVAVAQGRR